MKSSSPAEVGKIAYLISQYPAPSHTFIRREITAIRAIGLNVETFSIRRLGADYLLTDDDRREADATYSLLSQNPITFLVAHVRQLVSRPVTYISTFLLALSHRPPGLRSFFLAIAHFGESILFADEIKRRDVRHLHNHFANSGATVGLLASHHARISWSFTIHGISEFDYPAGVTLPAKIAAAQFVACVSYFGRAQAARIVDIVHWKKLKIVRCGLEMDRLPMSVREASDHVRAIFVGRLSAEKGLSGLLEAISLMKVNVPFKFVFVGDGPLMVSLKKQCDELGLAQRVDFLGRLPEAEALAEIAKSDVLVLPSLMEGLPIVLMEALALGVPVIASRVAGVPELVDHGRTGLLFSPSDWSELAAALDRVIGESQLRELFSRNGPVRIAEEFDVRISASKLRDLFREAVQSGATWPGALP